MPPRRQEPAPVAHLSPQDLADRLGISVETVYAMNSQGGGPNYMRVGKHARYRIEDVEAWEQSRLVRPA